MPAALSLTARLEVGLVDVEGVTGGVDARTGVGDVRVRASAGSVPATSEVGDVHVAAGTTRYALLEAQARVGSVRLRIDGHRIEYAKAPGSGDRVALRGDGSVRVVGARRRREGRGGRARRASVSAP